MLRYLFVFTPSDALNRAISDHVKQVWAKDFLLVDAASIPDSGRGRDSEQVDYALSAFARIRKTLDKHPPEVLRNSCALLDAGLCDEMRRGLNPLRIGGSYDYEEHALELKSLLVLAFPEVHWVFDSLNRGPSSDQHSRFWNERLTDRFQAVHDLGPRLFDPDGLRDGIRQNMLSGSPGLVPGFVRREELAAAVDDEPAYAYLHGYLAYRLGYRCSLVLTKAHMKQFERVEEDVNAKCAAGSRLTLVFEDLFLNFPDRSATDHPLSALRRRDTDYPVLSEAGKRVFVTVGHGHTSWREDNRCYLSELKAQERDVAIVLKPCGGVYDLLEKARLLREYWKGRQHEWSSVRSSTESNKEMPHSAPGRILVIADALIERAEAIYAGARSVQDCVHGALLALDAQELLGGRTPTTSLEAILLRHKLEVKAECMFQGMEYNIDVENRFREIRGEVEAISRWFHPSMRKRSALNAEMSVVTEIMRIFRDCGQFDEEQECLKRLRILDRSWFFLKHPRLSPLRPFRWYVETLLGSFWAFVLAVGLWPLLLGLLGRAMGARFHREEGSIHPHITNAYVLFFAHSPIGQPLNSIAQLLTVIVSLIGFVHLGIFIAYLYALVTRR